MKKLIFLFLIVNYVCNSQLLQRVPIYEEKTDKTGQTVDVIVSERANLYYDPTSYFKYSYVPNEYLHIRLGKLSYPSGGLTTISTENREDIGSRPNKNFTVGSTAGEASVNLMGAATYNIPIWVVPGTNDVSPKISLNYNSNSGNGTVGWGWNLSSISSISRIGKDKFHDEVFEKIQFTNMDKLILDGNRLVVVSGSEGNANALYALEIGNTSRVYPHEVNNNGYTWFEVKNIDGSVIEYGRTSNSRLETDKGVINWLVNKVTDANGNYVLYEYGKNTGEIFIKSISYTGNEKAGLKPYASVDFEYVTKDDSNTAFLDKIEFNQTVILKEIHSKFGTETVRKYVLEYINDNNYSQLYSITESDAQYNERYNSTIFEYDKTVENKSVINLETPFISELEGLGDETLELFGDFNGDKISDRILVTCNISDNIGHWYMQFGKYFGKNEASDFVTGTEYVRENNYSFIDPPDGRFQCTTSGWRTQSSKLLIHQIQIVDINGDGFDDVITPYLDNRWGTFGSLPESDERYRNLKIRIDTSDGNKLNFATEFTGISNRLILGPVCWGIPHPDYAITYENLHVGDFDGDGYLELYKV